MAEGRLQRSGSPTGITRLAFRAPVLVYRARLGFLLGHRFLMLEHTGRRSGATRRTVLEVVTDTGDAVYVASGWGDEADWLRNIRADPKVVVVLGSRRFATEAREVDAQRARSVLGAYGDHHPKALARLAAFMLDDPGDTTPDRVERLVATVPVIELPRSVSDARG